MLTIRRLGLSVVAAASAVAACTAPIEDEAARSTSQAATTTLVFRANADARVESGAPTTNFGTSSRLLVDSSPAMESYLRFDVGRINGRVTSARLRLYAFNATTNGPAVYGTSTTWDERTITWNARPAKTTPMLADTASIPVGWTEIDVTSAVTSGMVSFALVPTSSDGVDFYSREGTSPPELHLVVDSTTSTPDAGTTDSGSTADTTPPTVSITSPANGTKFTQSGIVDIVAAAKDDRGVVKVEFFDNGAFAGTEDTDPFSFSWSVSSAQNGAHRWTAKAYDAAGNTTTSAPIDVTVDVAAQDAGTSTTITASAETAPVRNGGDAADDAAVWVHPTDPALSTIIGTDKLGGLAVYDLSGKELFYYPDGEPNNVDIRYNIPLGGRSVALVVAGDKLFDRLRIYRVDPTTRGLVDVAASTLPTPGFGPYGLALYKSKATGKLYVFATDNSGTLLQMELYDDGAGKITGKKVRQFDVGTTTEGVVADDELGHLYIAEEDVAIWKYGAEPTAGTTRTQVDAIANGRLKADIEGLTIYYGANGKGYLVASSQPDNRYVVYDRAGTNAYVTSFTIAAGTIDGVSYTDGIDVASFALGPAFPEGVFIAQDNVNDGANQNFKLVPWGRIARGTGVPLLIDPTYDPRKM